MSNFNSSKKVKFLNSRSTVGIETSDIAIRSKFNFSFFDSSQSVGQSFDEWGNSTGLSSLNTLLDKLKGFTKEPLSYWLHQRAGAGGLKILAYYGSFPKKSKFECPNHIPHDGIWSRFRLGNKVRLIGFVVPEKLNGGIYEKNGTEYRFDSNTFYIVFLDKNHDFYLTERD